MGNIRMTNHAVRRVRCRRPGRRGPGSAVRCRNGGIAGIRRAARRWHGHRRGRSYRSRGAASGSGHSAAPPVSPRPARWVPVGVEARSASRILRFRPRMEAVAWEKAVDEPAGVQSEARAGSLPPASPAAHGRINGGRSRGQLGRASGPGGRDCTDTRQSPPRSADAAPAGYGAPLRVARAGSRLPTSLASERAAMRSLLSKSLPAWRTGCTIAHVAPNGDSIAKRLVGGLR